MRNLKNFTTKDWLILLGSMGCCIFLFQQAIRDLIDGCYISFVGMAAGCFCWGYVYFQYMRKIEKKNE